MNPHDRANLEFLLTASADVMKQWHQQASQDDYEYAMELLAQASEELALRELDHLDLVADQDLSQANEYLTKFRL